MQQPVPVELAAPVQLPAKRLAPIESGMQLAALQLMNQRQANGLTQSEPVQVEKAFLISNEEGNNRFADCYFPLRTNLPPGAHGLYKVTINEIMFNCTQPAFLTSDYLRIRVENQTITIRPIADIYPETLQGPQAFAEALMPDVGELIVEDAENELLLALHIDNNFIFGINYVNYQNNQLGLWNLMNVPITLEMSGGFYHYFNYPAQSITLQPEEQRVFRGIYANGPIFYLAETGARPTVNTRNNANHQFNAVGIFYNYNTEFRSFVQMSGTMQLIMSNVSNFRLRIVDDAGRIVQLRSPVFCHLTIEPNT